MSSDTGIGSGERSYAVGKPADPQPVDRAVPYERAASLLDAEAGCADMRDALLNDLCAVEEELHQQLLRVREAIGRVSSAMPQPPRPSLGQSMMTQTGQMAQGGRSRG